MQILTFVLLVMVAGIAAPVVLADDGDRHHEDDDDDEDDEHAGVRHDGTRVSCDVDVEVHDDGTRDVEVEFKARGLTQEEAGAALEACTGQATDLLARVGAVAAGTAASAALAPFFFRKDQ